MAAVDIYLHDTFVGVLTHRSTLGDATEFRLDDAYRDDPRRPVLGQVFEDDPGRVWRTTHRVPSWFSNLLPEGQLRTLLAEHSGVHPERELHLLAALGEDLPGAVTAVPRDGDGLTAAPLRPAHGPVDPDEALRFSLAGMQLKFSMDRDEKGLTLPVRGRGGRWIVKLPDPRYEAVPVNEATMLSWAEASGIDVPAHALIEPEDIRGLPASIGALAPGPALAVRRFDRPDAGGRVHIEDFAQIRGVWESDKYRAASYDNIGQVLLALCGEACAEQYVRRLAFMLLSGNADMHLKNWSLCYPDGRHPQLAPAYDLVATRAFPGTSRPLALKLSGARHFEAVDRETFRRFAQRLGLPPDAVVTWVEETQARARAAWPRFRAALPLRQQAAMDDHLAQLRL